MRAKPSDTLPKDDRRWAFEMRWDGTCLIPRIDGGLTLATRNRIGGTGRCTELQALVSGAIECGHTGNGASRLALVELSAKDCCLPSCGECTGSHRLESETAIL